MTAEQFEAAWRAGRRDFRDVLRVEVSPEFIAEWERRTRALREECDALLALVDREPNRRGNWLLARRAGELQREQWQLALIRDRVQAINVRALPPTPLPPPLARRPGAVSARRPPSRSRLRRATSSG
jgi:hypothetical protein